MSRIGIFPGTYDPIHDGHVLFAQTALEQTSLDKVVFMVERDPRRKSVETSAKDRIAMVDIIVNRAPLFEQLIADSDSMSVATTLKFLQTKFPEDDLFMILGADLFEHVPQWENVEDIIDECAFVVALKTEDDGEIAMPLAKEIGCEAEFIPSPLSSVSSTKIRQALLDNNPPKGLDDEVEDYIKQNYLYGI